MLFASHEHQATVFSYKCNTYVTLIRHNKIRACNNNEAHSTFVTPSAFLVISNAKQQTSLTFTDRLSTDLTLER